ncbi:MAG: translation elongation factor Ts [Thermodesulfovibrionales bacterium]|nr:translation elongation factor Ts [Thermodesulfovibrionales bacterium]
MAAITAQAVKELRESTGVGMMECKKALTEAEGDIEKAIQIMRERGIATAQKKSGRETGQGIIATYVHMDKLGVMVEVNCETDFVAKNADFQTLCKDIAMHIAAANPSYVSSEDVPADVIEKEKEIFKAQVEGKPENIIDKIVEGKVKKYFSEICLLDQIFVKDDDGKQTIKALVEASITKIGENIRIRRFARMQLGEE